VSLVLVPGGAGYVGSILVPKLVRAGHRVRVVDLYLYGDDVLAAARGERLEEIRGDVRDAATMRKALEGVDTIVHLACISNDPSFELDPALARTINYDAFLMLLDLLSRSAVRRFVFASTSSVYGIKAEENVTEELPLEPLTDYSKYKVLCEAELSRARLPDTTWVTIRPATVCGWSPRLRLDLSVNILTNHAVNTGRITVFGGAQKRPNIHIEDITDLYVDLVGRPDAQIHGRVFNAGWENHSIGAIAAQVKDVVERAGARRGIEIVTSPTNDTRSYHISSERIKRELGYEPRRTIADAVRDLAGAMRDGRVTDPMTGIRYYNIKTMQAVRLT
jgi:nucleoside-diphosphate-sugar epimerase